MNSKQSRSSCDGWGWNRELTNSDWRGLTNIELIEFDMMALNKNSLIKSLPAANFLLRKRFLEFTSKLCSNYTICNMIVNYSLIRIVFPYSEIQCHALQSTWNISWSVVVANWIKWTFNHSFPLRCFQIISSHLCCFHGGLREKSNYVLLVSIT